MCQSSTETVKLLLFESTVSYLEHKIQTEKLQMDKKNYVPVRKSMLGEKANKTAVIFGNSKRLPLLRTWFCFTLPAAESPEPRDLPCRAQNECRRT